MFFLQENNVHFFQLAVNSFSSGFGGDAVNVEGYFFISDSAIFNYGELSGVWNLFMFSFLALDLPFRRLPDLGDLWPQSVESLMGRFFGSSRFSNSTSMSLSAHCSTSLKGSGLFLTLTLRFLHILIHWNLRRLLPSLFLQRWIDFCPTGTDNKFLSCKRLGCSFNEYSFQLSARLFYQ